MNREHIKLLIHTEPEDGYPPEEWESLWAVPVGETLFRLDNIPFFAKGVSCDDIVEAIRDNQDYIFTKVVSPSENSTVRVVIFDLAKAGDIRKIIESDGCSIEGVGIDGLIAVNIPKNSLNNIIEYLSNGVNEQILDYEEGVIRR